MLRACISESFLNNRVLLHCGDCLDVLARLPECSIDSCCTDPPYHLISVYKRFANEARTEATVGNGAYGRHARGFMGKVWDGGDIAFDPETWRAVYRVLKPGAHLIAMGGTRTFHRLACAIEDAGFEIRDTIMWLYGSGFPKSHDVSKGIDRAAGAEREVVGQKLVSNAAQGNGLGHGDFIGGTVRAGLIDVTAPSTDAARQWAGFGTALKPACELIVLARKPLSEGTVAANVLRWGTGAINVDGCRVPTDPSIDDPRLGGNGDWSGEKLGYHGSDNPARHPSSTLGRWPANVVHDGSDEVVAGFPDSETSGHYTDKASGFGDRIYNGPGDRSDSGSAARFFYTAKADSDDRLGSKHPTVKPLDLMQWLVRLVTPPRGLVLDPFAGTGTTGEAAWREGMSAVLIEAEAEYQADIRRRMALALAGPDERQRESIKARNLPRNDGPLFAIPREAAE